MLVEFQFYIIVEHFYIDQVEDDTNAKPDDSKSQSICGQACPDICNDQEANSRENEVLPDFAGLFLEPEVIDNCEVKYYKCRKSSEVDNYRYGIDCTWKKVNTSDGQYQ